MSGGPMFDERFTCCILAGLALAAIATNIALVVGGWWLFKFLVHLAM